MPTRPPDIRHGFGTVRSYIHGPLELLTFIEEIFEARELQRHAFSEEKFHVEYQIGDSVLVVEAGPLPEGITHWTSWIYVYVQTVDATFARAVVRGAEVVMAVDVQPYGERMGGVRDMAGNTWWIATLLDA